MTIPLIFDTDATQQVNAYDLWLFIKSILPYAGGALGVEIVRMIVRWRNKKAEDERTTTATGIQAYQIADANLRDWMKIAKTATSDMLRAARKLNQSEMFLDEAIALLEKSVKAFVEIEDHLTNGTTPPPTSFRSLKLEIESLIQERSEHVTKMSNMGDKD